ncbi:hypothetical protein ACK2SD_14465 [Pseudomonas sp. SC11]|uniref:hypothetical protein n=1 Tax=Pseudomonas sp. SC11 TaxID=326927 RepID=UPI00399BBB09
MNRHQALLEIVQGVVATQPVLRPRVVSLRRDGQIDVLPDPLVALDTQVGRAVSTVAEIDQLTQAAPGAIGREIRLLQKRRLQH